MHPILFKLGPIAIGTYGVFVALGVFLAIVVGRYLSRKEGIDPEALTDFYIYSIIMGFVGAKIALIVTDFKEFSAHPIEYLFQNIRYFGAFYGGFIVAALFAFYFIKKKKLSFWKVADITSVSLPLGQAVGRWGCFFAGCCYGAPTDLPWGLVFPAVPICSDGTRIHPWPIYEFLLDISIFAFLFNFFPKRKFLGQSFIFYLIFYALGRFLLEFLRGDEIRGLYFNKTVSLSQILAVAVIIFAISAYIVFLKRNKNKENE
jgi:phosphatidylglycerol:prolipoprotein diacylglycerol transferase